MGFLQQLLGQEGGSLVPGLDNPFQSSQTVWLPGLGGLNPLNSQSAVGQLTKDIGALNPWNPDSVAGKVVNNIGQDMAKDPAKWVAIAAAVATGQTYLIPYINATATLTSQNASPEEWMKEGAKAYLISAGGQAVTKNVTGLGPQTDITTGETFAGTGASGAAGSAQVGAVAGNIARNIFATAARQGNTDVNGSQIVTGALTSEALNKAFQQMPGFDGLSKDEQTATVNAFKTAFNKDSSAAYQLFNQGFDATVKGLNEAAKSMGYKDLNQQNAVNNFVMNQGSTEDVDALSRYEQRAQDAYQAYEPLKEKNDAWFAKYDKYTQLLPKYNAVRFDPAYPYGEKVAMFNSLNSQWAWLQDPQNYVTPDKVTQAESDYIAAKDEAQPFISNITALQEQGWDSLAQQREAAAAGYQNPEVYDAYLTDKRAQEEASAQAQAAMDAAQDEADRQAAAQAEAQARIDEAAQIGGLPTEDAALVNPVLPGELEPSDVSIDGPEVCAPGFHWNGSMCVSDEDEEPVTVEDDIPTDETTSSGLPSFKLPSLSSLTPKSSTGATTQMGALPTTTPTTQTPTGIPWLDTKPQLLETKKAPSVMNPYEPLRQLYDPTLMNVLADRGITPQGYAEGSSVSNLLSQFSSDLDKSLPKFAESRTPFLSTGSRKTSSTDLGKLPQLKSGLTGHAKGGLPEKYAKAAPKGHNPEFITGLTGFYANGRGTGQSDDIPAMLHDGDYVMDADTVAALGDGSSKAGALTLADFQKQVPHEYKEGGNAVPAKIADGEYVFPEPLVTALGGGDNKKGAQLLDAMREEIRAHKRSAPTSKIPPKAKSPLDYLKMVKG
jgi:hypothetical protein